MRKNGRIKKCLLCGKETYYPLCEFKAAKFCSKKCKDNSLKNKPAHNRQNLTGKKFTNWTVIKPVKDARGKLRWECRCICGKTKNVLSGLLISGSSKSCGCFRKQFLHDLKFQPNAHIFYPCDICGKIINSKKSKYKLSTNHFCSRDCADKFCKGKPNLKLTTHGLTKTNFYGVWLAMKWRCSNPSVRSYKNYGGRGIKICERWQKFENFRDDMYEGYLAHIKEFGQKDTSIDRIDVDGNYSPDNCRWATAKEQAFNKRIN